MEDENELKFREITTGLAGQGGSRMAEESPLVLGTAAEAPPSKSRDEP